jgi:hypothetical protein
MNLTRYFGNIPPDMFFNICLDLRADQITLRKLYDADDRSPQSQWIKENRIDDKSYDDLWEYVSSAPKLRQLEYGQTAHSIKGISVVFDDDCMAKGDNTDFKYLIIRPDGKLYSSWDDPASLIF